MRLRNLNGIVLVLGLGLATLAGQVPGQGTAGVPAPPPPWAPSGIAPDAMTSGTPPVIASSRARKPELPPDARLPLPDDGLPSRPAPPAPTAPARPAAPPAPAGIQQAGYLGREGQPPPPVPGGLVQASAVVGRQAEPVPSGSALSIDIVGAARTAPGQVYPCVVVVRNVSSVVLADVRIELPLPPGARPMLPPPVRAGDMERLDNSLTWQIGNMEAGAERRLTADFRVAEGGEIHLRPRASFSTAVGLRAAVVRPPFSVDVSGPWKALPGEKVTFTIRVGNSTPAALRLVQIRCKLGAGLWHSQGDLIETEVSGGLAPGEQRTIPLAVEARGTGGLHIQVSGTADGQFSAQGETLVEVSERALVARLHGPRQAILGNQVAFRLEVDNPGRVGADGLRLQQVLPKGLEFMSASPGGDFDGASQTITWTVAELPASQRSSVTFQVRAKQAGDWALLPRVLASNIASTTQPHAVHVEAAPQLALEVTADEDTVEYNRETTYEVRISNQGATAAHAVRLSVQLPSGLAQVHSDGPTRVQAQGQLLLFEPLAELKGRAVAVYRLRLRGQQPGAGRFRVEVQAEGMGQAVQSERTIRVLGAAPARP